jgi:hypothetical protein
MYLPHCFYVIFHCFEFCKTLKNFWRFAKRSFRCVSGYHGQVFYDPVEPHFSLECRLISPLLLSTLAARSRGSPGLTPLSSAAAVFKIDRASIALYFASQMNSFEQF